jgi:hypothetical protein
MADKNIRNAIKRGLEPQSLNQKPPTPFGYPKPANGRPYRVPTSQEAAKVINNAMWIFMKYSRDNTMFRRLQSLMRTIRFSRRWHVSRSRSLTMGNLELLKGFKFNQYSSLSQLLKVPFNYRTELEHSRARFCIPSFSPRKDIVWPEKAAFFRIKSILIGLDLDKGFYEYAAGFSGRFSRRVTAKTSYEIINEIPRATSPVLIYCCGIDFYSVDRSNKPSRILELKYNPLEIGAVDYMVSEKVPENSESAKNKHKISKLKK